MNQDEEVEFSNKSFVETIRPYLLIYADLNEYGRKTRKISTAAQHLRSAIMSATDPEKAFFDDFVSALGFANLKDLESDQAVKNLAHQMDACIEEIKTSYEKLLNRIEACIVDALDLESQNYEDFIPTIKNRYVSLEEYQLVPYQKKLLKQLTTPQPGRREWISSVAFAVLDKPLENIDDEEEPLLLKRIQTRVEELDNLRDLSKLGINEDEDEAYSFKITPLNRNPLDLTVSVKKDKLKDETGRLKKLKKLLTDDKKLNIALLLKLIEDQESDE